MQLPKQTLGRQRESLSRLANQQQQATLPGNNRYLVMVYDFAALPPTGGYQSALIGYRFKWRLAIPPVSCRGYGNGNGTRVRSQISGSGDGLAERCGWGFKCQIESANWKLIDGRLNFQNGLIELLDGSVDPVEFRNTRQRLSW
ncbi:MAG TPA: hypothetical protein DCF63_09710, partial [Planctomycetaceae bacterium]|nr:hypothetical protein [Planctomycetaceae bacterium]